MKVYYISPTKLPSRAANAIHVVNMCEALTQLGHHVTLFVSSNCLDGQGCKKEIQEFYGIDTKDIGIVVSSSKTKRGIELKIALRAILKYIMDGIVGQPPDFLISRNLYASVFLGIYLRRKVVYETHAPEKAIRRKLQRMLVKSKRIACVVISRALRKIIAAQYHESTNGRIYVMPDAARSEQVPMNRHQRMTHQKKYLGSKLSVPDYQKIAGYFGHLYPGRGVDMIQGMAAKLPHIAFIVYGGNESEIKKCRQSNQSENLYFMGHLPPASVRTAMAMMDVLLMPYQKTVSVGLADMDTAQWMSPMKLFEYMSVGVPIISSDLSVLREVLIDRENCLLAVPDDVNSWVLAMDRLMDSDDLCHKISARAYEQYRNHHTWYRRAEKMISIWKNDPTTGMETKGFNC